MMAHPETKQPTWPVKSGGEFAVLATVYITAYLVDLTETWEHPVAAAFFIVAALLAVLPGISGLSFYLFLILAAAYTLWFQVPDVTNHENIYLISNLFLILGLADHLRRSGGLRPFKARVTEQELIGIVKPTLRLALSIVYIFAGFHKLNWDFFHPESGCAMTFFRRVVGKFGIAEVVWPGLVVFSVPVFVLAWELVGGVLLWFRRLQLPVLVVAWFMHALLAQLVFTDFSSLAFALMLGFVPAAQFDLIARAPIRLGRLRLQRATFYLLLNVAVAVAAGIYGSLPGPQSVIHRWQGLGLNIGFLVLIWPILADRFSSRRTEWSGVPVWRPLPWWRLAFVVSLTLFGLNPYLGLRTSGTFSMFSNLRTEGVSSNHLLLADNPLKLWAYQEDVVEIIDIDPRHDAGLRRSLKGYLLPVVEFKKRIYDWRTQGLDEMSAVFKYQDRIYETEDLVRVNPWRVQRRDLEMYHMDFRAIQKGPGPNACRW
jgi:hypothetical protein